MVRLGVMADETIGNSLNFGQNSVNTTATKGALHRPSRQGASVIIHNISPTSGKEGPCLRHVSPLVEVPTTVLRCVYATRVADVAIALQA
ncbi:hypothetical protein GCM10010413_55430 [Promicromonospora sukumoe]